jgi:hypothetical protein
MSWLRGQAVKARMSGAPVEGAPLAFSECLGRGEAAEVQSRTLAWSRVAFLDVAIAIGVRTARLPE